MRKQQDGGAEVERMCGVSEKHLRKSPLRRSLIEHELHSWTSASRCQRLTFSLARTGYIKHLHGTKR